MNEKQEMTNKKETSLFHRLVNLERRAKNKMQKSTINTSGTHDTSFVNKKNTNKMTRETTDEYLK